MDNSLLFSPHNRVAKPGGNAYFDKIITGASDLHNGRLAILFYILDTDMIALNQYRNDKERFTKVQATLYQIWKNVRTIVRNNPNCRRSLNLNTQVDGVYIVDVAFDIVNRMWIFCDSDRKLSFTLQRLWIMVEQLNNIEIILRDILQYFQYFMRTEYKQMPDLLQAVENYKRQADKYTVEQLRAVVGKHHQIDFEGLGMVPEDDDEVFADDDVEDYVGDDDPVSDVDSDDSTPEIVE